MYAFLTLLCIIVALFLFAKSANPALKKEGFEGHPPLNTDSKPTLPDTIPPVVELPVESAFKASDLPGPLPTAPYQQIGANLPSPYQDPALIKTTRQRILNALELVKGFLSFQAQEIEDRSDPTIQLPLNTARSDFQRLESEANVLQRNPGLTPHLTMLDIAQIEDNLDYLKKEVELIGSNRPFQGPQHDVDLEGFESPGAVATKQQLSDFSTRIQQTITTLTQSGTTDPTVQARVGNLTVMKTQIDSIIKKLNSGKMSATDVPILESDINKALPILGNVSSPILPILKNIMEAVEKNAPVSGNVLATLSSYINTFLDNADASFSFNVDYNGTNTYKDTTVLATNKKKSCITDTGFPSPYDLEQVAESPELNSIRASSAVTDMWAADPRAEGRTPATGENRRNYTSTVGAGTFDWKGRCKDIENQIKLRGLNPNDFGVLPKDPGPTFPWKGHTKMICSRLQAVNMNRTDEMCGCPPANWKGWNA